MYTVQYMLNKKTAQLQKLWHTNNVNTHDDTLPFHLLSVTTRHLSKARHNGIPMSDSSTPCLPVGAARISRRQTWFYSISFWYHRTLWLINDKFSSIQLKNIGKISTRWQATFVWPYDIVAVSRKLSRTPISEIWTIWWASKSLKQKWIYISGIR